MRTIIACAVDFVLETRQLDSMPSSTENTFYPAIKTLISAVLKERRLPFTVRVNTSEAKGMPDFVLGDNKMFVGVYGEVKRPNVTLENLAEQTTAAAITYFYEPFLEAFDPTLRENWVYGTRRPKSSDIRYAGFTTP